MHEIQIRRHSLRAKPADALSADGVDLARRAAIAEPTFDFVASGSAGRVRDTVTAMGHAIDEIWLELDALPQNIHDEIGDWEAGCHAFAQARTLGKRATILYLQALTTRVTPLAERGGARRALLLTHGAVPEAFVVACFPHLRFEDFSTTAGYCQGYRVFFSAGMATNFEPTEPSVEGRG